MTFKDVYKFPLEFESDFSKVYTADFNMAFDFVFPLMRGMFEKEILILNKEQQEHLVKIINNEQKGFVDGEINYLREDGIITLDDKVLLMIRGWGYLTSPGGLNLPPEKAKTLQDEFAEYIIEKLKRQQ